MTPTKKISRKTQKEQLHHKYLAHLVDGMGHIE